MPSAISSPREPVEIASIPLGLPPLPRRMIEPLPNARSIWDSAASSALVLSIPPPSTTRSVLWAILPSLCLEFADRQHPCCHHPPCRQRSKIICTRFVLGSQDVLAGAGAGCWSSRDLSGEPGKHASRIRVEAP